MNFSNGIDLELARAVPLARLPGELVYFGDLFGNLGDDSQGRALVVKDGRRYLSGYQTGEEVILLAHLPFASLKHARKAAKAFTRESCC